MQTSASREEATLSQNNTGMPAMAELTAAAPAVIPQNTILKRQVFCKNVVVSPTPGEVISKLGSSTWEKKRLQISKKNQSNYYSFKVKIAMLGCTHPTCLLISQL